MSEPELPPLPAPCWNRGVEQWYHPNQMTAYGRACRQAGEAEIERLNGLLRTENYQASQQKAAAERELGEAKRAYRSELENVAQLQRELAEVRADAENMLWNLGGISTLARSRTLVEYTQDGARPALNDVAALLRDYLALRAQLEAAQKDAERWRTLVSLSTLRASHLIDKHGSQGLAYVIDKETAAIDAARAEKS